VQLARVYRRPVVGQESPQSLIEQYEAANEELESAAEEIRSSHDELVKANEALELSQKSLTAELKRKDQFIAILAHELRNPLAAMGLTLEVMRRSSVAAILDEDFQAMDRQIKSLARLADDVQDMARIRQGKLTSRMAVAAVAAVGLPTPLRILVVEDNADVADRLVALLGADGHEVRLERDGLAAIASLRSFSPQAVLLDIGLPGVDGYEVARRIRQHPGLRHVVIVGLSGYAQEDARRQSKEAGFDEHLAKPVDLKVIRATLARLVASRSAGPPPLWIVR
jgi:CheY-like chemotaxis protein